MQQIEAGTIDLVFADPPFNIGYEYDEYHDEQDDDEYVAWSRAVDRRSAPRAQAGRHVLAGDRRRIRGRAEGRLPSTRLAFTRAVGSCGTTRSA